MRLNVPAAFVFAVFGTFALFAAGCNGSSTSPSTGTSAAVAAPTISEDFTDTLPVNGVKFYSFTVGTRGTVNLTLNSVGGTATVPSTVQVGLALGAPSGTSCSTTTTPVTAGIETTPPQVTGTFEVGVHCAQISDVGNLAGPAVFDITIAHP